MPSLEYFFVIGVWVAILIALVVVLLRQRRKLRCERKSLRLTNAALGVLLLLVALTVPELCFALFYDATDSFSQTNVSKKWYDRHVVVNKAGYRDVGELPTLRESGRVSLGFIGDSFTFGHGVRRVADRFSDRVAAGLNGQFPGRTSVFNTGLPGVEIRGLTDELVPELIRTGTPMDVLVYVFVPNDIEYLDERTAQFYQAQQSQTPQFFLIRNTYFYNWLYYRVRNIRPQSNGGYYDYLAEAYTGPPWSRFAEVLDRLQLQCAQHQIELRVVIFPFLSSLGKDDPFAPGYDKLAAHCADRKLPCLDLRPTLTPHLSEGLVVSRFDAHPNERAHALAAEAILKELSPAVGERLK